MRPYAVFLIVAGCTAFGSSCAYTLNLVFQIGVVGLDPLGLVLVGTVLEVVYLVAQVPMGILADLRGRRLPVVLGVLLTGAATVLQGAAPTVPATIAGTALFGVGAACFDGAFEAWAADELGEAGIGAALVRGAQLAQAASIAGMLAASALSAADPSLPLLAGGAVWLALGLLLLPAMRARPAPRGRPEDLLAGLRAANRAPRVRAMAFATLFVALGREGFDRLGQAHLLDALPGAGASASLWLGGLAITTTLAAIPLTRLLGNLLPGDGPAFAWLLSAQVAAMAVFALADRFALAAAAAVVAGALRSAADPLWTAWLVARTAPATRATVLSAIGMLSATGEIAGGPPAGWIGRRFSVARALLACAAVTLPGVVFLKRAGAPRDRRRGGADAEREPARSGD
ncbi:MFS transporter [Dactylosporangium darangshiense]|uniref:MFS transporter n=1 Tax=Dactylosporangium darangshiense TaxID=579108 RepID=A0ABP8D8P2_9ACTN